MFPRGKDTPPFRKAEPPREAIAGTAALCFAAMNYKLSRVAGREVVF